MANLGSFLPITDNGEALIYSERPISTIPALGNILSFPIFGVNPDIDTGTLPEDIIETGGLKYWPDSEVQAANINFYSTSANDIVGGSGAQEITIVGVNGSYQLQNEVLSTNGTIPVNPAYNYLRIFTHYVSKSGSSEHNEGTMYAYHGTVGIMSSILPAVAQSQEAVFTIPAFDIDGNTVTGAYMSQVISGIVFKAAATTESAEVAFLIRNYESNTWRTLGELGVIYESKSDFTFNPAISLAPKSDLRLTVLDATASNLYIIGFFNLILETE